MKDELKQIRAKLEDLAGQAETLFEQMNTLFEEGYNEVVDSADDPDSEETADAAAVWDLIFDEDTSIASAIDAIDAALGEE